MKSYYRQDNIGKAKYTISHYDGESTHKDGSPFWDIAIFKNKKTMLSFCNKLAGLGYIGR